MVGLKSRPVSRKFSKLPLWGILFSLKSILKSLEGECRARLESQGRRKVYMAQWGVREKLEKRDIIILLMKQRLAVIHLNWNQSALSFKLLIKTVSGEWGSRAVSLPGSSVMGFSRQEYWSGLPFPPPGDLPDPGIKLVCPVSPALQADSLMLSHWGRLHPKAGILKVSQTN